MARIYRTRKRKPTPATPPVVAPVVTVLELLDAGVATAAIALGAPGAPPVVASLELLDAGVPTSAITLAAPVLAGTLVAPLIAYREADAGAGSSSDLSINGVLLPRAGFAGHSTLTPTELASVGVFVDGVQAPCWIEQRGRARPDGTLDAVWLEYAPGVMSAGAEKSTIELRKGISTPLRRTSRVGQAFTADYSRGVYENGVMPCYSMPALPAAIDSQAIDAGVRIPTATELATLTAIRGDQVLTRFAKNITPFWDAAARFPGTGGAIGIGGNQSFDRLTTTYWPDATNQHYAIRVKILDPIGYYDQSRVLRHHWLATGDRTSFRRSMTAGWYYAVEWCWRERERQAALGVYDYMPTEFHQSAEALYQTWLILGEDRLLPVLQNWAENWYKNGYHDPSGYSNLVSYLNEYDPAFPSTAYRSRMDGRQAARALMAIRLVDKTGATTDHNGNARDWAAIYRTHRARVNLRGTNYSIRAAPAPYAGLLWPDGVCGGLTPDGYYCNTWMAQGQLGYELEAGLAQLPETDAPTLAALRATYDGLTEYLTTGPRYTTFVQDGVTLHVVQINQDDGNAANPAVACSLSTAGSQAEAAQYGVAGYRAAARIGGATGATITARLDTLIHDSWVNDDTDRDFNFYSAAIGKIFNQHFSYVFVAASRKLFG